MFEACILEASIDPLGGLPSNCQLSPFNKTLIQFELDDIFFSASKKCKRHTFLLKLAI